MKNVSGRQEKCLITQHAMICYRYCPGCKNDDTEIVKAGEKLKESKKKAKMASTTSTSNRDWGRVSFTCIGEDSILQLGSC